MTYEKRILSVRVKANVVHTKIKNLCTSFDFAEAIAKTALPRLICCSCLSVKFDVCIVVF